MKQIIFSMEYHDYFSKKYFSPSAKIPFFSLQQNEETNTLSVIVLLKKNADIAKLIFENVKNISLNEIACCDGFLIIYGFSINYIKDRQLEHISWEINDYEDNTINFFCENIIVEEKGDGM